MHISPLVTALLAGVGLAAARANVAPVVPSSSCSPTPIPHPPAKLHCGQQGTLKNVDSITTGTVASQNACRNACLANKKCISFGYNTKSKVCYTYAKDLDAMGFKNQATKAPIVYYNRRCFREVCTTTTTTTSSTLSSTSTTTSSTATVCATAAPTDTSFALQAISGSGVNGLYGYINPSSGHLHFGGEGDDFTWGDDYWYDGGLPAYLDDTYTPNLVEFTSSDPSGQGPIVCGVDCNSYWVCNNTFTGTNQFAVYCNGDSDDHAYFTTSDAIAADGCSAVTLMYIPL